MKSNKMPYIIYTDIESLIRKIDRCANHPEKSSTMKIGKHIPCGLPEKEKLFNYLNLEEITDADYMHGKRVYKDFEMKNLGEYYDFYLKSGILLLANFFENFRNIFVNIYELNPTKFLSVVGLW